jgi:hypothetical protein
MKNVQFAGNYQLRKGRGIHLKNVYSAGNYQLIDEESTQRRGFLGSEISYLSD